MPAFTGLKNSFVRSFHSSLLTGLPWQTLLRVFHAVSVQQRLMQESFEGLVSKMGHPWDQELVLALNSDGFLAQRLHFVACASQSTESAF